MLSFSCKRQSFILFMAEWFSSVPQYISIDGHLIPHLGYCELSCFKHWGADNSPICWFRSVWIKFQSVEWLGHMEDLFSDFWGSSILSFIMVVLVHFPFRSGLEYPSPTSSSAFMVFWLLYKNYSNLGEVKLHCGFIICISPMASECELFFPRICSLFAFNPLRNVHVVCPFCNWIVCFLVVEFLFVEFLCRSWILLLYHLHGLRI